MLIFFSEEAGKIDEAGGWEKVGVFRGHGAICRLDFSDLQWNVANDLTHKGSPFLSGAGRNKT